MLEDRGLVKDATTDFYEFMPHMKNFTADQKLHVRKKFRIKLLKNIIESAETDIVAPIMGACTVGGTATEIR